MTIEIVYIHNPKRAHKLLPLLEDFSVVSVKGWRDLLGLVRDRGTQTAVVVDGMRSRALRSVAASVLMRAPLVIRLRGEYFREERERTAAQTGLLRWPLHLVYVLAARLCFLRARAVIFNSRYLAWAMAPYVRGKRVAVVHNPCTVPDPTPDLGRVTGLPDGGLRLLTVMNMNLASKIGPIAEAICEWVPPELWEELDLRWVVCGGGYHEGRLREAVREKGLEHRVRLLGRVENVSGAYEWCSAPVHRRRIDAFPNTPMEAMAHGKPVITNTESCGTREQVFDGENGFVVEDAASFVAALRAYAADPGLRERHGRAGRRLIEGEFSVETQRSKMRRALEELLHAQREGARG